MNNTNIENTEMELENEIEKSELDILKDKCKDLEQTLQYEKNKYLYLAAELDNYKKRVAKEKQDLISYTKENFYNELLPLIDDMERVLINTTNSNDVSVIKDGNIIIYNKFKNFLEKNNIKEIDDIGFEFNPELHEAISTLESTDGMKHKIVDVISKGYIINNKVIRHSKVIVGV